MRRDYSNGGSVIKGQSSAKEFEEARLVLEKVVARVERKG
jgi:hypothetical protein